MVCLCSNKKTCFIEYHNGKKNIYYKRTIQTAFFLDEVRGQ